MLKYINSYKLNPVPFNKVPTTNMKIILRSVSVPAGAHARNEIIHGQVVPGQLGLGGGLAAAGHVQLAVVALQLLLVDLRAPENLPGLDWQHLQVRALVQVNGLVYLLIRMDLAVSD